jgi:hypothetical protein
MNQTAGGLEFPAHTFGKGSNAFWRGGIPVAFKPEGLWFEASSWQQYRNGARERQRPQFVNHGQRPKGPSGQRSQRLTIYFQATNPMKIDSLSLSIPAFVSLTNLASR